MLIDMTVGRVLIPKNNCQIFICISNLLQTYSEMNAIV